jgi:hypothetical protein
MTDNESLSSLKSFLEAQAILMRKIHSNPGWKYGGFEELVLDCGALMKAKPLPQNIKHGSPKQCYWNCQEIAFKRGNLTYVEGYAIAPQVSLPVAHAWLLTPEGDVIDPTWNPPGTVYLGVPLSTNWLKSFLESRRQRKNIQNLSIFEGNYLEHYSLLKHGLPPAAYSTQSLNATKLSSSTKAKGAIEHNYPAVDRES